MPIYAPSAPVLENLTLAPKVVAPTNITPIAQMQPAIPANVTPSEAAELAVNSGNRILGSSATTQNNNLWTPYATRLDQTTRYNDSNIGFDAMSSANEYKYADAHWAQNIGNNILKFGANTIGAFGSSIITIPNAIGAIKNGKLSQFYDNDITNTISEWTEGLETSLPTYTSQYRDNHPILSAVPFFGSVSDLATTWSDLLKNLGFTVGSIAGAITQDVLLGAATGGSADVPLVAMQIGKAAKYIASLGKSAKALGVTVGAARSAVGALATTNRIASGARYALSLGTSAISEASIEANQTYRQTKDMLANAYRDKFGVDPDFAELKKIEQAAIISGNTNLVANTALLTITNAITLGGFLGSKAVRADRALLNQAGRRYIRNEAGELVLKPFTRTEKWVSGAGKLATPFTEAFEEGSQFLFDKSIQSYALRKYDDPTDTNALGDALAEGAKETLLSDEGQYSMFMGALSGGVINLVGGRLKRSMGFAPSKKQIEAQQDYYQAILADSPLSSLLQTNYNAAVEQGSIAQSIASSVETGSQRRQRNDEHQRLHSYVHAGVRTGRADQQIEELNMLRELDDASIEKMSKGRFNATNRAEYDQHVDNLVRDAKDVRKSIENVDAAFINRYDRSKDPDKFQAYEDYKQQLSYLTSMTGDTKRRIDNLSRETQDLLGTNIDITRASDLFSPRGLRTTITRFEQRLSQLDELINTPLLITPNEPNSENVDAALRQSYAREKAFLKDKISTLRNRADYFENRANLEGPAENTISEIIDNVESYERYLNDISEVMNYIATGENSAAGMNMNDFGGMLNKKQIAQSLEDIYSLDKQERDAMKLYKMLATKKGLGAFNRYRNQYLSDNKFLVTDEDGNKSLITADARAKLLLEGVKEAFNNSPAAVELFKNSEAATPAEQDQMFDIVEKEAAGIDLTEEEQTLKESMPKRYEATKALPALYDEAAQTEDSIARTNELIADTQGVAPLNIYDPSTDRTIGDTAQTQTESKTNDDNKFPGVNPVALLGKSFGTDSVVGNGDQLLIRSLYNILFTTPYDQLVKGLQTKLSFNVVKAQERENNKKITHRNDKTTVAYPNLERTPFSHEIQIFYDGVQVGILTLGNSIVYIQEDSTAIPLSQLTAEQYQRATIQNKKKGGPIANQQSTYEEFMAIVRGYEAATNSIISQFESGKTEFDSVEISQLYSEVGAWFGARDEAVQDKDTQEYNSTKIAEFEYLPDGAVIVKVPMINGRRSTDPTTFTFVTKDGAVDYADLSPALKTMFGIFDSQHIKPYAQDKPYYVAVPQPDGVFSPTASFIIARPAENRQATVSEVVGALTGDKQEGDAVLDGLYINITTGDNNKKGIRVILNRTQKGQLNVHFQDKNNRSKRTTITFTETEVKGMKSIQDIINMIGTKDTVLDEYGAKFDEVDFQISDFDSKNLDFDYMADNLTASVSPNVFKDFFIHVKPRLTPTPAPQAPAVPVNEPTPVTPAPVTPTPAATPTLPTAISGAKPRYGYGNKLFELTFTSDIDKAAYITAQATPSKKDAEYLKFVMDATGMSEAQVRALGKQIRDKIKAVAKDAPANAKLTIRQVYGAQSTAAGNEDVFTTPDGFNMVIAPMPAEVAPTTATPAAPVQPTLIEKPFSWDRVNEATTQQILDRYEDVELDSLGRETGADQSRAQAHLNALRSVLNERGVPLPASPEEANPITITDEMRDTLYTLNYEKKDIDAMTPTEAQDIVNNRTEKEYPVTTENRLFEVSRTIRNLAASLEAADDNQRLAIMEQIETLQEELADTTIGNDASFIENNLDDIIEQLKASNQLNEEC